MKTKDLTSAKKKDIKQLKAMVDEKKADLRKVNLDMSLGQESNVKKARLIRKDIAQIMTIIREKELVEEVDKREDEKGNNI